jgi:D-serine deaminase-like pyridoxal phosphate-dependent protein
VRDRGLGVPGAHITEMAALAYEAQVALRPHIKTHKTPQIAAMQLDNGAVGLTCAKVGEAEVLADAGFTNLFVCYPIVTEMKARRLAALAARPGLSVSTIVDSPQGIVALSATFAGAAEPLETLVKVNTGLGRVGVAPGAATVDLARSVAAAPGLRFGGVCAHEGFTYGLPDPEERAAAACAGAKALVETAEALSAAGLRAARVSVGATPGIDTLATVTHWFAFHKFLSRASSRASRIALPNILFASKVFSVVPKAYIPLRALSLAVLPRSVLPLSPSHPAYTSAGHVRLVEV